MGYPTLQEALLSMKTHGKYKIVWSKIKKIDYSVKNPKRFLSLYQTRDWDWIGI